MTIPIPTGPRVQNQLNTMEWEMLKHSPHTPDLMPCNFEVTDCWEKNPSKDTCSHQSTMCRRLWYTGFGNSSRNYLQMEYNSCINKLLLERNNWEKLFNTMTHLTGSTISAKKSQYGTQPSTKKDVTMESS
jgi:hypothetical protein